MMSSEFEFRRRLFSGLLDHCFTFRSHNRDLLRTFDSDFAVKRRT